MRVLLLDVNCKYSSTGKIVYDLYSKLNADGHTAAIGYGRGALVTEPNIVRFSPKWEVYVHALLTRVTGYTGCFSYFATKRLFRFLEEFKPDVVHLNDMHGYFVNIIPLIEYLKKKEIKTVWTFHCEFMYTGKCGHSYECGHWQIECGKCPYLRDYPQSLLFDHTKKMHKQKMKAFSRFDKLTIAAPSRWLAGRVEQSFLKGRKISIVYNGVDTSIFCRREYGHLQEKYLLDGKKVVLAAAPNLLSDRKGGRYVLKLAERMKDEAVVFVLIGVEETAGQFADNVIAIGLLKDQRRLAEFYSLADLFVICSKRENFPTTCIEALNCGTPVAGFDEGGTAETAPGELGRFVEYGNLEELEKKVKEMLFEGNLEEISRKSAAYGIKHYSKEAMYEKYLQLYMEG